MHDGWLLDITDTLDGQGITLWTKDRASGKVDSRVVPYRPPFLVDGPKEELSRLSAALSERLDVNSVEDTLVRPSLFDRRRRRVLSVTPRRNDERRRLAARVDALGDYHTFALYDVDLTPGQLYHLGRQLYPFAPVVEQSGELIATEPAETIAYAPPPLTVRRLTVGFSGVRPGGIVPVGAALASLQLGETILEGDEGALLTELTRELACQEPDVLLTDGGDELLLPRLYERAEALGFDWTTFVLGRAPVPFRATRNARSFVTYGQVIHRSATYPLAGRFHVDGENSFLFGDVALEGLIESARLSRLSLQTVVRQSPGTCFNAMEMAQAVAMGVHIPWKKNRPEEFKSARKLVEADRGGVIFQPPVGVFDRVDEFDFASLYPHIMVRNNLSTETLECRCCPKSPMRAPGLGYRSCTRSVGLIPRTLKPLLTRRLAYKAALKRGGLAPREAERLKRRVKMLKWILVTAFGYQGYRNARFGRIECHEAINAYARELLADLVARAEAAGYQTVHGLVDSLWLTPKEDRSPEPEAFAQAMSRKYDLPLGYEGRYRWILFLPAVTGLGVPNRYYGRYESGEYKLRGIGARRHDTTGLVRRCEGEILSLFGEAWTAKELKRSLPRAIARVDRFAEVVRRGDWPVEELLITHRVGKELHEFVPFTDTVAALRQLHDAGAHRSPGEYVRYVVLDRSSRSWRKRVRVAELLEGNERYDAAAYLEILARAAETLLAPLGINREELLKRWEVADAPERDRYRSPEDPHQSRLGVPPRAPGGL